MGAQPELTTWKVVAPEFVFGRGVRGLAGRYAKNFGLRRALVVSDAGVVAAGWTEQVVQSLHDAGVSSAVFSQVTPNPRAEEVMAGAEAYEAERCNGIVVVGGGSPMDCAKGIGIVSSNRRHILEFEGIDQVPLPGPPLICVPTTAGSAADVSQFAIITDPRRRAKISIVSKALVPDVSLIDPITSTTMPSYVTACTGIDALAHGVEAFVSSAHSPITDLYALEAIRLVTRTLPLVFGDPCDVELRSHQMLGSIEAGLAFSNASLGAVHAIAHSLGGFTDLAHGECNAMLLGPVITFNFEASVDRYLKMGEAMGLDLGGLPREAQRSAIVDAVERLRKAVGCERTLDQIGVRRADFPAVAERAMADVCIVTNPRELTPADIEDILETVL